MTYYKRLIGGIREFMRLELAAGVLLLLAALLALVLANSPLAGFGRWTLLARAGLGIAWGPLDLVKPLLLWINDGLMALFFLLVGLRDQARGGRRAPCPSRIADGALPVGQPRSAGMLVPALFYIAINWSDPSALRDWAIPAATDIAFSLGVLAALGSRVPLGLKGVPHDPGDRRRSRRHRHHRRRFYTSHLSLASP